MSSFVQWRRPILLFALLCALAVIPLLPTNPFLSWSLGAGAWIGLSLDRAWRKAALIALTVFAASIVVPLLLVGVVSREGVLKIGPVGLDAVEVDAIIFAMLAVPWGLTVFLGIVAPPRLRLVAIAAGLVMLAGMAGGTLTILLGGRSEWALLPLTLGGIALGLVTATGAIRSMREVKVLK